MNTGELIAIEEHFLHPTLVSHFGPAADFPPGIAERLYDIAGVRLEEMDRAGITMQVLSHQSPGSQRLASDIAVEVCRATNDALAEIVAQAPTRFAGFAMLPTTDPANASDELRRSVEELGLKGAMIHGLSDGRFVDTPEYWPIYAAAEALDVPIYLHPAMPDRTVIDRYYAPYTDDFAGLPRAAWGFGVEAGTQAVRLILSGVFEKHPNLKIVLGHLGEAIPFLLPRIDEALSRPGNNPVDFANVFRRNFHVTTSGFFSDAALRCCLDELGSEKILFAVDWPYADNDAASTWFRDAPLSDAERDNIAHANARRLLRM